MCPSTTTKKRIRNTDVNDETASNSVYQHLDTIPRRQLHRLLLLLSLKIHYLRLLLHGRRFLELLCLCWRRFLEVHLPRCPDFLRPLHCQAVVPVFHLLHLRFINNESDEVVSIHQPNRLALHFLDVFLLQNHYLRLLLLRLRFPEVHLCPVARPLLRYPNKLLPHQFPDKLLPRRCPDKRLLR